MRFMAMASTSCASGDSAPSDMAGAMKRLRISLTDSTCSTASAALGELKPSRSRRFTAGMAATLALYCL